MHESATKLRVRYVETDKMGVVHHSNYFAWFELGRADFIIEAGMTYRQMEEQGIMIPLMEANCKYLSGAYYDDEIMVYTKIQEINGAKVIFNYTVVRVEDQKKIAQATTKHAFVNCNFKIINLQKTHPVVWKKLICLC